MCLPVSMRNRRPLSLVSSNSTIVPSIALVLGRGLVSDVPVVIGRASTTETARYRLPPMLTESVPLWLSFADGYAAFLDDLIHPRQHALQRLRHVRDLELEEGLRLDEVPRALRIGRTRNLDHDAVGSRLLDRGLRDTKPFDASANHLERTLNSVRL